MKPISKQVVLAFALGFGVAAILAWCGISCRLHRRWGGRHFQERLLQQLTSKLQLTQTQQNQIAGILESKRQKMETLRAEIRSHFEELRASTSAEIRQLLTPEQQPRFDELEATWKARRQRFRDHWMKSGQTE